MIYGRYRLIRELGHGGFGRVYLAEDTLLQHRVAVKVLSSFGNAFTALTEATLLASLPPHPNICPYQRTLTVQGSPVIIMPYAERGSLVKEVDALSANPSRIIAFALQAAAGLSQVHAFELIHGDVKPQNLLLFEGERLAVADFGLAMHISSARHGRVGGTEAYLPPDNHDPDSLGRGVDWYAWALTFIETFIGYRPWKRGADAIENLESTGVLRNHSSGDLLRRLTKLLRVPPSDREQVAYDLISEFSDKYCELTGTRAPEAPRPVPRPVDVSTYVPGLHRVDLAGAVFGPEALLLRSEVAISKAGLDSSGVRAIGSDAIPSSNRISSLASSVVTFGRLIDALAMLENSSLVPFIAEAWSQMGLAYAYLGNLPGAVEAQTEALNLFYQMSRDQTDANFNQKMAGISLRLADSLSASGEFQEACGILEQALNRAKTITAEFELRIALANARSDLGCYDLAIQVYSDLIARLDPEADSFQLARLYHERGGNLARLRRLDEAEADLRMAIDIALSMLTKPPGPMSLTLRRQFPSTLKLLGTVLTDQGNHREAVKIYNLAIEDYKYNNEIWLESELGESISSIELSMSFSLGELGDNATADRVLSASIDRRRRLLASGHDPSAPGLANGLFALTRRRLAGGEHLEARAAATECLRLARTLEAVGSRYNIHEIALRCLALVFDFDQNLDEASRRQTLMWAVSELDALEEISESLVDQLGLRIQRAQILYNLSSYVTEASQELMLLDEAAKITSHYSGSNQANTLLGSEILIKSAAVKRANGDHLGALQSAEEAVKISRTSVQSQRQVGNDTAAHDLILAKSLMLTAVLVQKGEVSVSDKKIARETTAASEALSILRAIDGNELEAHQCADAAEAFVVASNFLPRDPRRDASDAMHGFHLSVRALQKEPSAENLERVSRLAQAATARHLKCDDPRGAEEILSKIQELATSVRFPNTIREPTLDLIRDLVAYLSK